MTAYLCCDCDHKFTEPEAVEVITAGGFVLFCCPKCRSHDIEDAANLEQIRDSKGSGEEAYRSDMIGAGRGHLLP